MHKLKTLLEIQLIKEALPLDMARRYTNIDRNPDIVARQDSILDVLKQQPGAKVSRRGDRVAVPFKTEAAFWDNNPSSELVSFYNFLDRIREQANYVLLRQKEESGKDVKTFEGYPNLLYLTKPTVKDQYNREVKVSKYITTILTLTYTPTFSFLDRIAKKDPDTKKLVITKEDGEKIPVDTVKDSIRRTLKTDIEAALKRYSEIPEVMESRANKDKLYYIIVSKHAYDIAGMSTNRGWSSCMNLYQGSNAHYIQHDVKEGTLVAYLVRENDLDIKNPTARISIKPFIDVSDETSVLYEPEDAIYGTAPNDFLKTVKKLIDDTQPNKTGEFKLVDTLYCDTNRYVSREEPELRRRVNDLLEKRETAATVDEAKFILTKYFHIPVDAVQNLRFTESDKLYVSGILEFFLPAQLKYCPIAFDQVQYFDATNVDSFINFPKRAKQMRLVRVQIPNFQSLPTAVEHLTIVGCDITDFTGLSNQCHIVSINNDRAHGGTGYASRISSFNGLPTSVNKLYLDNQTVLDMTIDEMLKELAPVGLTDMSYRINPEFAYTTDKFHTSIVEKMDELSEQPKHRETLNNLSYDLHNKYKLYAFVQYVHSKLPTAGSLFGIQVSDVTRYFNELANQ